MDLSLFAWSVSRHRHRVVEIVTPERDHGHTQLPSPGVLARFLTTAKPDISLMSFDSYRVHDAAPGLYREFARLDGSDPSIIRFADRNGMLGKKQYTFEFPDAGPTPGGLIPLAYVERVAFWQDEITAMRYCVDLWDALADGDHTAMEIMLTPERLAWAPTLGAADKQDVWVVQTISPDQGGGPRAEHTAARLVFPQNAPQQAHALAVLQDCINWRLQLLAPSLKLAYDEARGSLRAVLVPRDLLSAMWMQLLLTIDQGSRWHQCRFPPCGRWFQVRSPRPERVGGEKPTSSRRIRGDKHYCSDACRVKHCRQRNSGKGGNTQ